MKAYSFSETTYEYLGVIECQPDPKDGGFLIPAYAVLDPPPVAGLHEAAVWTDERWELVPDYRRVPLWYKQTAIPIQLPLGQAPTEEITEIPPPANERAQWNELIASWVVVLPTAEEIERDKEALRERQLISTVFVGRILVVVARELLAVRQGLPMTDAFKALLERLQEIYGGST